MTLLSAEDLVFMRETQEEALPTDIDIIHLTKTKTQSGGYTAVEAEDAGNPWPGRISIPEGREAEIANRLTTNQAYMLTMAHDAPLTSSDRVSADGVTYEIVAVNTGDSWRTSTRAVLQVV